MAKSAKQRVKEHYDRMIEAGYKQTKIWLKPEQVAPIKALASGDISELTDAFIQIAGLNKALEEVTEENGELVWENKRLIASGSSTPSDFPEMRSEEVKQQVIGYIGRLNEIHDITKGI